ncbi:MAG: nitroreductase family protein, partial [Proteobacteria bacterium]|nr:nitroreductase family protein [Pseudomonadota bacterium]
MSINSANLIDQLKWRYATKKFDSVKKISAENWAVLEESLILSPSSFGLQPWKFLVVDDKETRKQLRKVSWDQSQIEDASHMVVFAVNTNLSKDYVAKYVNSIASTRGVAKNTLDGLEQMMN